MIDDAIYTIVYTQTTIVNKEPAGALCIRVQRKEGRSSHLTRQPLLYLILVDLRSVMVI